MKIGRFWSNRRTAESKMGGALALAALVGTTLVGACRSEVPIGTGSGGEGAEGTGEGGAGDAPAMGGTNGANGGSAPGGATYGGSAAGGQPPVLGGNGGSSGGIGPGGESSEGGRRPDPPGGFPGEPLTSVSKLDLLLVVDDSVEMDTKQPLLRASLHRLIERLTGEAGFNDIHVGVISTSLGASGSGTCELENDSGRLIPTIRSNVASWNDEGFSVWDPNQAASPPGHDDEEAFLEEVLSAVEAVGSQGCGYEASLESWYRFLVDPSPPEGVEPLGERFGVDQELLAQRAAFLRPDSALAIVLTSDENDCSIVDYGQGWLVGLQQYGGARFNMPRPTSECAVDPDSKCCRSCAAEKTPPGCRPASEDRACRELVLSPAEDSLNLRCWDQKRRFGFDLLQPTERYVEALTQAWVWDQPTRAWRGNPIFTAAGGRGRRPNQVLFTAILGVPWQDVADSSSLAGNGLEFLSARELTRQDRWSLLLPSSATDQPNDPFMIESNVPRSGTNPITGDAIQPNSAAPVSSFNAINGHEDAALDRLETACSFALAEPVVDCQNVDANCVCRPIDRQNQSFECQAPGSTEFEQTQYHASATPGTRQLEVLSRIGDSAVIGSICPKFLDPSHPDGLYKPTLDALADRLAEIAE
jgi:hypothetical protein